MPLLSRGRKAGEGSGLPELRRADSGHAKRQGRSGEGKRYGITRVPAVVINGKLADCCATGAVNLTTLRELGLGVA